MAPSQHSGAANMNMSLPVSNAREDSIHGTTKFDLNPIPNTKRTFNFIIVTSY